MSFWRAGVVARFPGVGRCGIRVGLGDSNLSPHGSREYKRNTRCALSLAGRIASGLAHPIKSRLLPHARVAMWGFRPCLSSASPCLSRRQPAVGNTGRVAWTRRRLYWPFMATESGKKCEVAAPPHGRLRWAECGAWGCGAAPRQSLLVAAFIGSWPNWLWLLVPLVGSGHRLRCRC